MVSNVNNNEFNNSHPASTPPVENLTQYMPPELMLKIFSYLSTKDLKRCDQVSKRWMQIARDPSLVQMPNFAFGKKMWEKKVGKIGNEPPLPRNIKEILEAPCPIFGDGKKVKDTHMLVLTPETVNGKPLTLNSLEEIFAPHMKKK